MGLFLGGAMGSTAGSKYIGEFPHWLTVIKRLSAGGNFLLYVFGGFTVIALSYFRASKEAT
ncbi:hypothetical protein H5T51_07400 [Candidatus Bathyarchaeota archaeon]|nr:hypothetical protein [Candidatus Bathyarchaeota archaeon]